MIAFAADVLIFELSNGDHVPYSAEMISVELMGETADLFDEDFVRHASKAVFHLKETSAPPGKTASLGGAIQPNSEWTRS